MKTQINGNDDARPLLADGRPSPELIRDDFPQPNASNGEPEGYRLHDSETREVAAEGEGHGDEDTVAPELAARDDAGEGDDMALEPAPTSDAETGPQLDKQSLDSLLDELTGELVALEDFPHEVDDRAFENEWLGRHTDLSLTVFHAELLKTGEHTDDVDENGKLLSDPVKSRLARGNGARISLRVHRGLNEDKKIEFILRAQARERSRIDEENRELKRRLILRWLALGLKYESIAKLAGVCANTVRNVETRAAADSDSKLGITKKDRRLTAATPKNIEEARRLHAEGKSNSEIARLLGVSPATVTKLLADPAAPSKAKAKAGKGKKAAAAQSADEIEDIAADDGIPELHRLALRRLDLPPEEYAHLDEECRDQAQQDIEKISTDDAELVRYDLYGKYLREFAQESLEERCRSGGEQDVDEEAPWASCPDTVEYEADEELDGAVHVDEPDVAPVSLPTGDRGVIAQGDTGVARHAVAEDGDKARIRVNGFESEPGLADRDPMTRDDRPRAVVPNLGDRSSPYERYFGRKGEPKK